MILKKIKFKILIISIIFISSCTYTKKIDNKIIDLKYYTPKNNVSNDVAIIFVGGSEGGFPIGHNYSKYTDKGIPCLSLAYFNTKNTPETFNAISLEYFYSAIKYFKSLTDVQDKKIIIFGYSKGAELSLLLASKTNDINGVIAINPSNVIFQSPGSLKEDKINSSWTYLKEELPFIRLNKEIFNESRGKRFKKLYEDGLNKANNLDQAIINVENINGPILLLSGTEDIVWPATYMSDEIIKRLVSKKFPFKYKHIAYEGAGHTLNEFIKMGGSFSDNKFARKDANIQITTFIDSIPD